jgi:hypothetical protein
MIRLTAALQSKHIERFRLSSVNCGQSSYVYIASKGCHGEEIRNQQNRWQEEACWHWPQCDNRPLHERGRSEGAQEDRDH